MFYLNQFFKSTLRANFLGVLFIMMTALLVTVSFNKSYVGELLSQVDESHDSPYFNALISKNINLNSISRKLNGLPGVEKVRIRKNINAQKELGALGGELKSSVLNRLKAISYSSLTVELSKNIKVKSQNLVREYLTRLVGKKSLTLSGIKYPRQEQVQESLKTRLLAHSDSIVIGLIAMVWLFLFSYVVKKNNSYFYLLEKFQRKKSVKYKTFGSGILLISTLTVLANLYSSEHFSVSALIFTFALFASSVFVVFKLKYRGPVV